MLVPETGLFGLRTEHPARKYLVILMQTNLFNGIVLATIGINCIFLAMETQSPKFPFTPAGRAGFGAECDTPRFFPCCPIAPCEIPPGSAPVHSGPRSESFSTSSSSRRCPSKSRLWASTISGAGLRT